MSGSKKAPQRVFTTEPKTRRHLYGLTQTRKNAAHLMELLFQNDFLVEAPYDVVKQSIIRNATFIGLDERTLTGYIGRPRTILDSDKLPETEVTITYRNTGTRVFKRYSGKRILREKQGLCQQLGYMKFEYRGETPLLIFNHVGVPLPYHLTQKPLFDSEKSEALRAEASKDGLCVSPILQGKSVRNRFGGVSLNGEANIETVGRQTEEREESLSSTHKHSKDFETGLTLSPREKLILKGACHRNE